MAFSERMGSLAEVGLSIRPPNLDEAEGVHG
jgi:hypothetical protein